jgi:hypothetical protein
MPFPAKDIANFAAFCQGCIIRFDQYKHYKKLTRKGIFDLNTGIF